MRGVRRIVAIWLALLLSGAARAQPSLEQVNRDLAETRDALQRIRQRATRVLDELAAAEQEVRLLEEGERRAEAEMRAAEARLAEAERAEGAERGRLVALVQELSPRLRLRYALTRSKKAELLLSASSLSEALRRRRALDRLLESDLDLLRRARDSLRALSERRAELDAARAEREAKARSWEESKAKAQARQEALAALHEQLLSEQGLRERTLRELRQAQAELTQLIDGLEPHEAPEGSLARRKGKLLFPTQGIIEVAYGKVLNAKFNTVTFHKGIDVRAPAGTEVVAVARGKVVHAAAMRGYGNLVILDHGGGYHSLYAHLAAIEHEPGDWLEAGDVVGHVGDTGSLKGPFLYFELRENGRPVDPRQWLAQPRPPGGRSR